MPIAMRGPRGDARKAFLPLWRRGAATVLAGLACSSLTAGAASAADAARGQALFAARCAMCHSIEPGAQGAAPNLHGVVGRKAGSTGFAYTPALKHSDLVWTPAALDSFLAAPSQKVPGTAMPVSVPSETDRADIVAFLAKTAR